MTTTISSPISAPQTAAGHSPAQPPAAATPDQNVARWRELHEQGYFARHRWYQDRLHDLGVAEITRLAELVPTDVLLEVGCGYGRLLWHLSPLVSRVVGIDLHDGPLQEARTLLRDRARASIHLGDGRTLAPIDSHSVDKLCAFTVLQHMTRDGVRGYLREFARVLTPSGRAIVNFHDDGVRQARMLDQTVEQSLCWSPGEIAAAVEEEGLILHRLERQSLEHLYPGRGLVWWWAVLGAGDRAR